MNNSVKVSEAIQVLDPEVQAILAEIISRTGANGETTVTQLLGMVKPTTGNERHALLSLCNWNSNKFAPKLSFAKRCEILALYRAGLTRESLAAMYKIDRRTVTHIYNPMSPHYKNVREMETGLGVDKFRQTYLSDDTWNKALMFSQEKDKGELNNKYAKAKEGVHIVRGKNCLYEHRVIIQWREKDDKIEAAGWYYKDLDSDFPDNWFSVGPESCRTSMTCYVAMLQDITDKAA
jgi:hypothetical protein